VVDRIQFHPDENVDPDIAKALRRYGINVTTTIEAGLRTTNDIEELDFSRREQRIIVTHDADFLRLAYQEKDHPGIVYCDRTGRSIGEIVRGLILIYEVLTPEEISGKVEFL
jgi:predicted nuclease of predicted toxin-antitoxin system